MKIEHSKNQLLITIVNKSHPYPKDPTSRIEAWGEFTLEIHFNDLREKLLQLEWNLDSLADWYISNLKSICNDDLSNDLISGTLAKKLKTLINYDFQEVAEQDTWSERLSNFQQVNNLSLWFPGSRCPSIIIGCNHGFGEISYVGNNFNSDYVYFKKDSWFYSFDMELFLQQLRYQMIQFLQNWEVSTPFNIAKLRANELRRIIGN